MMFGLSLDFFNGGYSVNSPTALWWKQLATAVVFGLGIATVLTLVFTPSMLALRGWMVRGAYGSVMAIRAGSWTREGKRLRAEWAQQRAARKIKNPELIWDEEGQPLLERAPVPPALPEPEAVKPGETDAPAPQEPSPDNTDSRPSGGRGGGQTEKGSTDAAE
jgi:multidrug efflux pump